MPFVETVMRLKMYLIIFAWLAAAVAVTQSADKPIDLTGTDANTFRSQVGHTVILRGRLADGKEGFILGAIPNHVLFYVLQRIPPTGVYPNPTPRPPLMHHQCRL